MLASQRKRQLKTHLELSDVFHFPTAEGRGLSQKRGGKKRRCLNIPCEMARAPGDVDLAPGLAPDASVRDERLQQEGELDSAARDLDRTAHDRPKEISVSTHWASLLDTCSTARAARRLSGREVWLVDSLLSERECAVLLASAEAHGFGVTDYEKAFRGNLRLTTSDLGFAEALWQRLRAVVPASLTLAAPRGAASSSWWESYPHAAGTWEACGLNECWRLAKYHPGDQFMIHCDEAFVRPGGLEMGMFSVNIYMNAVSSGGRTRFYLDDSDWDEVTFAVTPRAGSCLLFQMPPGESYYHDGEVVRSGVKYLFRSEVMYRKVS